MLESVMTASKESDQAGTLREGAARKERARVPRRLRCIAVSSGKGGVGKTVVSIGLAFCLARMGYRVLILDGDLGLANVDLQMGLEPKLTIQDVVFGNCSLEDAVISVDDGPDVLPSSSGAPEMVDMGNARRQLFVDELIRFSGDYEFLIIDGAAGIGQSITAFLSAAPEVLVIVANEPTSIMDAYSLIKILTRSSDPPSIMIVVNMVRSLDEGEMLAKRLNRIVRRFLGVELPVAGVITYDESVGDAIRARRSVMSYAGKSAASRCLEEVAGFVASGRGAGGAGVRLKEDFFDKLTDVGMRTNKGASK